MFKHADPVKLFVVAACKIAQLDALNRTNHLSCCAFTKNAQHDYFFQIMFGFSRCIVPASVRVSAPVRAGTREV